MLTILLGRSGSGKSTSILKRIKEQGASCPQILLVPEQASFETERRLCESNGNGASLYAEVFSFTSLAQRVSALSGGLAVPVLDEGGRLLVMYAALKAVSSKLSMFGPAAQKPEFLTQLISTVDELKSYCVTPAKLSEIAEEAEGLTGKKLQDFALIYGMYDAMTTKGPSDPRDKLTRLSERLQTFSYLSGKDIYIDGFTDFTPQEMQVLIELIRQGRQVTVALTCDHLQEDFDDAELFSAARHTAFSLIKIAKAHHVPVRTEYLEGKAVGRSPVFSYLDQNLFSDYPEPFAQDSRDSLSVVAAANCREEVTWTAGKIRDLLQTGQYRYRDIAVAARNIQPYRDVIESTFARYEIPVFQSSMQSILQKPVFTLVMAALDIVTGSFAYEDVFRYLKTGLTNVSLEECDELENYALLWNIRGHEWTASKGFYKHPRGYQQSLENSDLQKLQKLNEIRCKVVTPFDKLRGNSKDTIKDKVISLYSLMEEIQLSRQLEKRADALLSRGEPELAMEYHQLWDVLCNALEQCVDFLGDVPVDLEEFSRLLKLLFSRYTVGSIPASLDRVITGDIPRLSNRHMKVLFILGAEDSSIPQLLPRQGLFSEEDRELLSDYGVSLAPPLEAQMSRELTMIYTTCTQPTEQLYVTWPGAGEGGGETQPSFLVERLRTLFPQSMVEGKAFGMGNDPGRLRVMALSSPTISQKLEQGATWQSFVRRMRSAASWKRGRLSRESIEKLYGSKLAISPSRLDQYKSCRFAFFIQYGLKAKARKQAGFHAPEYGTFVHYILEYVLKEMVNLGGIAKCSDEQIEILTGDAMRRYIEEVLGGLEQQTPRFRYLFLRLQRTIKLVIQNVVEELRSSQFQPMFFELGFGWGKALPPVEVTQEDITLSVSGFVDRVDGWLKDGRLYLKVVDYKTGRKSFDFTDIWNGLGLQMLLYLFALEDYGKLLGQAEIIPAGVLYLPARDAVISGNRDMGDEEKQRLIDKELTRKGLILDEPTVLEAMEYPSEQGLRFLPIRVSAKTGKVSGDALVTAEQLGRLKSHIRAILKEICIQMKQGEITADPYWRGPTQNACLYCDYLAACHFEEGVGDDHRRWIPSIRNSEFWTYLEEQESGGGQNGD